MYKYRRYVLLGILILGALGLGGWWYANRLPKTNTTAYRSERFPLRLKWETDLGVSVYAPLTYQNGMIFVPGYGFLGTIYWYRVNSTTGEIVWSKRTTFLGQANYFRCFSQGKLVLSGPWGLMVLKASDGADIWSDNHAAYEATCHKDALFSSGAPRDSIMAFYLGTGKRLWGPTSPSESFTGVIYNPQTDELIATQGEDFYLINAKFGFVEKSFPWVDYAPNYGDTNLGSLYVIDQGEIFVGGSVQDTQTGEIIHKEERFTSFPPSVSADTIYLSVNAEGIIAFDRSDYQVKWVYQPTPLAPLQPLAPLAILDKTGYAIFSDNSLRAIDLKTGQEVGYWQSGSNSAWPRPSCSSILLLCDQPIKAGLATSDDILFVSFGDGKLYAFER